MKDFKTKASEYFYSHKKIVGSLAAFILYNLLVGSISFLIDNSISFIESALIGDAILLGITLFIVLIVLVIYCFVSSPKDSLKDWWTDENNYIL